MTNQTKSQMFQYNISTHRAPLGRARDASTPSPSGENTEAVALFLNEKGSISNEKLFPEGNFLAVSIFHAGHRGCGLSQRCR